MEIEREQQARATIVLMGVSGSGKSAVAAEAAKRLGAAVLDGDFLHPRANVLKMARGEALNDEDRWPWLERLNDAAFAMGRVHAVSLLICSALKRSYRERLREGNEGIRFVYLKGSFSLIEGRLLSRKGHYFKTGMLTSQFETLEEPGEDETDVMTVEIDRPLEEVAGEVIARIRDGSGRALRPG